MGKARSKIKLGVALQGVTFVDSKAYGPHVRAKRGTYTPISLAPGMKESSGEQKQVNLMAKIIFDAVNEFAPGFKDGKFWSRLLSVFRKQKKAGVNYSYTGFYGMEMRDDYPSSKHGMFQLKNGEDQKGVFIKLNYRLRAASGYSLKILRILSDQSLLESYPLEMVELMVPAAETRGFLTHHFTAPPENSKALYVLQCDQLNNGKSKGTLSSRSVSFFKTC